MRGQHWLFSIGPTAHTGSGGKSSPPYIEDPGTLLPATAKVILSDCKDSRTRRAPGTRIPSSLAQTLAPLPRSSTCSTHRRPPTPAHLHLLAHSRVLPCGRPRSLADGKPKGAMTAVAGKANVFQREFESATVTLDCNTWTPTFEER